LRRPAVVTIGGLNVLANLQLKHRGHKIRYSCEPAVSERHSCLGEGSTLVVVIVAHWERRDRLPPCCRCCSSGCPLTTSVTVGTGTLLTGSEGEILNTDVLLDRMTQRSASRFTHGKTNNTPEGCTLPAELLQVIFSEAAGFDPAQLMIFASVCREWYDFIVGEPSL